MVKGDILYCIEDFGIGIQGTSKFMHYTKGGTYKVLESRNILGMHGVLIYNTITLESDGGDTGEIRYPNEYFKPLAVVRKERIKKLRKCL
jgi:hypothetical protein